MTSPTRFWRASLFATRLKIPLASTASQDWQSKTSPLTIRLVPQRAKIRTDSISIIQIRYTSPGQRCGTKTTAWMSTQGQTSTGPTAFAPEVMGFRSAPQLTAQSCATWPSKIRLWRSSNSLSESRPFLEPLLACRISSTAVSPLIAAQTTGFWSASLMEIPRTSRRTVWLSQISSWEISPGTWIVAQPRSLSSAAQGLAQIGRRRMWC